MRTHVAVLIALCLLPVTFTSLVARAGAQDGRGEAPRLEAPRGPILVEDKVETSGGPKTETKARISKLTRAEEGRTKSTLTKDGLETPPGEGPTSPKVGGAASPKAEAKTSSVPYVGVIAGVSGCPAGSSMVSVYMDDEDHNNSNTGGGWVGAIVHDKNTLFRFCRVDGSQFSTPLGAAYAVVQLADSCPSGTYSFSCTFDNENHKNNNSIAFDPPPGFDFKPNVLGYGIHSYTRLNFCVFPPDASPAVGTPGTFPDFGIEYGVFASNNLPGILDSGHINIDDEDNGNDNTYGGDYSKKKPEASRIVSGSLNTSMQIVKAKPGPQYGELHSVSLNVSAVEGNHNGTNPVLTVSLDGPAPPGGRTVYLSSNKPGVAWIKDSSKYFTIPGGHTSATRGDFLATRGVAFKRDVRITVTVNGRQGHVDIDIGP